MLLEHEFLNESECFIRHRVSKRAQHNGQQKLSFQNLKIRVTRYPCGSRDKAESSPTKAFYTSINPVHSEAKQPVEFHGETADGVLTPQFNRSNENPIIYLKEKRAEGWRSLSSHHQKQNLELGDSASIPCQLWWWGLSRPCS